jgi:hypothetical protein
MRALNFFALACALGTAVAPATLVATTTAAMAQAQPTKQQLETAVKAAHPTIGQLRALKKLEPNMNNMTPAQLKSALGQIFSPQQLATIHQSLVAQGVTMPSQ